MISAEQMDKAHRVWLRLETVCEQIAVLESLMANGKETVDVAWSAPPHCDQLFVPLEISRVLGVATAERATGQAWLADNGFAPTRRG